MSHCNFKQPAQHLLWEKQSTNNLLLPCHIQQPQEYEQWAWSNLLNVAFDWYKARQKSSQNIQTKEGSVFLDNGSRIIFIISPIMKLSVREDRAEQVKAKKDLKISVCKPYASISVFLFFFFFLPNKQFIKNLSCPCGWGKNYHYFAVS